MQGQTSMPSASADCYAGHGGTVAYAYVARTKASLAEPAPAAVEYPYSDGKIMAEAPRHVDAILNALMTLRNWFAGYPRVHVGAEMFLYYEEGDVSKRLTPDLFVVRGLKSLPEPSYKIWEEGRPPTFVLEVASPSTEGRDHGEKKALYASMGVAEYWRFHPTGILGKPAREGARFEGGVLRGLGYEPLETVRDGAVHSEVLGLEVRVDERPGKDHLLRFRDPRTGEDLLTAAELDQSRREAESGRHEAERRQYEAERKQHEAERKQHEAERRQHEAEQGRREAVRAQSEAEERLRKETATRHEAEQARRAETVSRQEVEAELARLRAQLDIRNTSQDSGS